MGASFDLSYTVLKGNSGRLSSKVSVGLLPFGTLSQNSDTERMVPELILVLSSQPAGDVSHKHGGKLPLLSARPAVSYPRNP